MRFAHLKLPHCALGIATILNGAMMQPIWSQLPSTTLGKFVHQPGDNQYGQQSQRERHPVVEVVRSGVLERNPEVRQPRPDVSLEPIAADEPLVHIGFPPLPDRLDLPIMASWRSSDAGGVGPGGAAAGAAGATRPRPGTRTQGPDKGQQPFVPDIPRPGTRTQGPEKGQQPYGPDSSRSMRREPRLNQNNDQRQGADPPTPLSIRQSQTQDLSLPDDDFSYKRRPSARLKMMKGLYQKTLQRGASYGNLINF